jgi:large subunit ribosomal protein L10
MPNLVNEIMLETLKREFRGAGSCLIVSFDKLQPDTDIEIRDALRDAGVRYRVVRNRLALRAFADMGLDMAPAFQGKCGVAMADREGAIKAARVLREVVKKLKEPPLQVTGGIIEGEAITGPAARTIADMPDRHTVNTQIVTAISGPARAVATVFAAVAAGMARCIQARIDKAGGAVEPTEAAPAAAGPTA